MTQRRVRCALYTRKSSEEGLEQGFNSLDAQREACEAYVKSQAGEGWRAVPTRYDDGGWSGGTMERPGLKVLLADITAGKIDVVVVYKIDRLTRSLADFARMVELFDAKGISFVSVTQSFNTTSSMGRLTLNVLLSFAQFEREVTGERIRDKIEASKRKGMWMGGMPPLGYDPPTDSTRALVVNEVEAGTVRTMFALYLELGTVRTLELALAERDIRSKAWMTRAGQTRGGGPFSRGALFHLLANRIYLGQIVHRQQCHAGLHQAIISQELFDAVQAQLAANRRRTGPGSKRRAPLTGRLFDADGQPMSPTTSRGAAGRLYRYYVSAPLQRGRTRRRDDDTLRRVSAKVLEARIAEVAERLLPGEDRPMDVVTRIDLLADGLRLTLPAAHATKVGRHLGDDERLDQDDGAPDCRVNTPAKLVVRGGRTLVIGSTPSAARRDPTLIRALRAAHKLVPRDASGMPRMEASPSTPYLRRLARLAFLAPDIQVAILAGTQPPALQLEQLMHRPLPLLWDDQAAQIGH
jgi:site-specific DNA recombinase